MLSIALDDLSLSRVSLIESREAGSGDFADASRYLREAVTKLRHAGMMDELPRGLLARAELYRLMGDFENAERDLSEVQRVAKRSEMDLHLADYHLESARLQLAQNNKDAAREHVATAKEMIDRMGYHRRDKEVAELEA